MQTENRFLDGMARFLTDAAGAAQAFRSEMETMMKARFDRLISDLDLVQREEFEAVKAMAAKARAENESWRARLSKTRNRSCSPDARKSPGAGPRFGSRRTDGTKETCELRVSSRFDSLGDGGCSCQPSKSCVRLVATASLQRARVK